LENHKNIGILFERDVFFLTKFNKEDIIMLYYLRISIGEGVNVMQTTMTWREERIFPAFTYNGAILDAVESTSMKRDEQLALASLQGIVNRREVRLMILDMHTDEGSETWIKTLGYPYQRTDFLSVFKKYVHEIGGAVLYDARISPHYINLACTAASTQNAVPMTERLWGYLMGEGVILPVVEDLTTFTMTAAEEIYTYAYNKYWQKNTHRLIVSQAPHEVYHLRDLVAAAGCAVVFCENRREEERLVYEKFLADMEPGKAIAIGWYTEERSGITTATAFGLSTVPGDLFSNFTVFASEKEVIIPEEPPLPEVEDKMYVALFASDGDNIQYVQRYMRKLWDATQNDRGKVSINWTISPSLADTAPDILQYYYDTATEKDCLVSGPSGLGYAMPVNTLAEEIEAKNYVRDDENFAKYAALSNRYFERSGLRAVTVWDNMTENQRKLYAENAPYLYGMTVQLFTDDRESISSWEGKMPIKQLTPCYTCTVEHMMSVLTREVEAWDKKSPKFMAAQFSVWGKIRVSDFAEIEKKMKELTDGRFEFVRADTFFCLYRQNHRSF